MYINNIYIILLLIYLFSFSLSFLIKSTLKNSLLLSSNKLLFNMPSTSSTSISSIIHSRFQSLNKLPELLVFDLDECLWTPEMYTLNSEPTIKIEGDLHDKGKGVIALSGNRYRENIKLYPDALHILQYLYLNNYHNMKISIASSADTPLATRCAYKSLELLEILPNISLREVINNSWKNTPYYTNSLTSTSSPYLQIGRTPPLSSNKGKTHLKIISHSLSISFDKMLFYDDCNWSDNCQQAEEHCPNITTQKTPHGMTIDDFFKGLEKYNMKK